MLTLSMGSSLSSRQEEAVSSNQSTPDIPHPQDTMTSELWKHLSAPRRDEKSGLGIITYSPFHHFLQKWVHYLRCLVYPSLSPDFHLYTSSPSPDQIMETCQGSRLVQKLLCYLPSAWLYRWPPRAAFHALTVFTVCQQVKQPTQSN